MTPPRQEPESLAGKALEALSGGKRRSDSAWALGKTIALLGATMSTLGTVIYLILRVLAGQMEANNRLVEKIADQWSRDQQANREAQERLGTRLDAMTLEFQGLSATLRAVAYISRGADAPQRQGRHTP
jgi:hypothetical protein